MEYTIAVLVIVFGYIMLFAGLWNIFSGETKLWWCCIVGFLMIIFGVYFVPEATSSPYYLEAEPIAYNTDTTIFSTPNGYYTANTIYDEDTMYLLTMDDMGTSDTEDDEILVVWKCDEGSVG